MFHRAFDFRPALRRRSGDTENTEFLWAFDAMLFASSMPEASEEMVLPHLEFWTQFPDGPAATGGAWTAVKRWLEGVHTAAIYGAISRDEIPQHWEAPSSRRRRNAWLMPKSPLHTLNDFSEWFERAVKEIAKPKDKGRIARNADRFLRWKAIDAWPSSSGNLGTDKFEQERFVASLAGWLKNELSKDSGGGGSTDWTDWTPAKNARTWFDVGSTSGWTRFARSLREARLLENHPTSGAKKVRIQKKAFDDHHRTFPAQGRSGKNG